MNFSGQQVAGDRTATGSDRRHFFLLISGFNDRAILTLCRIFRQSGCSFGIVASGRADSIWRSEFANDVVFCRLDMQLDNHFLAVLDDITHDYEEVIICPTSEYLNQHLLRNRSSLASHFLLPLVSKSLYEKLSNKRTSIRVFCDELHIHAPKMLEGIPDVRRIPFVAKPIRNIIHRKSLYPYIIKSTRQLESFLSTQDVNEFFFQEYIEGLSFYYCFYVSRQTGECAAFVQENLCQEPEGKSVLWARKAQTDNGDVRNYLGNLLKSLRFFGWIMIEVIRRNGKEYFIEANPRVWGPLQLAIDCCPEMGALFIHDWTGERSILRGRTSEQYVWLKGLENHIDRVEDCRWYVPPPKNVCALMERLAEFDVEAHDANFVI